MCGIAGFWQPTAEPCEPVDLESQAVAMAASLRHRGPDDGGVWIDPLAGVALAQRRLSIIDLSAAGHQPMVSASGRFTIVFNGEIYNHAELRTAVERSGAGVAWRGHSDTESLLAAIELWGLERALERSVGMFALALWDATARRLSLARDRLGEKPLYYGWQARALLFGSELVALRRHPSFLAQIDRGALSRYLNRGYVAGAQSIYEGVHRLPPGSVVHVSAEDAAQQRCGDVVSFWKMPTHAQASADSAALTPRAAADQLLQLLRDAVRGQMIADVPLGAFLSGGIDSSLIVALMQEASDRPVKSFTIGFCEPRFDEAPFARAIAKHLGTDHHELYVTPQAALEVVEKLSTIYSEPLGDSSQIPTFMVASLARQHVTVALSGDGGDELFCGYERYFAARDLWHRLQWLPGPVRSALGPLLNALPVAPFNAAGRVLQRLVPGPFQRPRLGEDLRRAAPLLAAQSALGLYLSLLSQDPTAGALVVGGCRDTWLEAGSLFEGGDTAYFESVMQLDRISYLPDDILVKVDRAAMAVSLETRVPFLDHRVVQFATSLAQHHKRAESAAVGNRGKQILRELLSRYVPRPLFERPKAGFSVPVAAWLRGPLRMWGESLVGSDEAAHLLNLSLVRRLWREHQVGLRDWQYVLWSLLMFLAWHREQLNGK
jgi:asparagine synthase (glutamine-hydrolysing)